MMRRLVFISGLALLARLTGPGPASGQSEPPPIRERIGLRVTGDPASADFLSEQIRVAVINALTARLSVPAGSVSLRSILPAPQALERGFLTSFGVAARIDPGGGAPALAAQSTVDVTNVDRPGFLPVRLSFADDPERITADGVLSRTRIAAGQPTRLYYYHENRRERRRFCVVLSVNDSVRTRVQIVGAAAGPDVDVMGVGHAVTKTFLLLEPRNEGIIVTVAGGKPLVQRDVAVSAGDGVVGAIDVNVLDGGPLTVTVLALPPGAEPAAYLYGAKLADDGHFRHGSFDLRRFAQTIVAYTAGGADSAYVYGIRRRTLENAAPGDPGRDYGDYGVLRRVTFDLDNPSASPVTLYLYEKPLGGPVRSSFEVNGTVVDVGCVRVAHHYLIARYELGPRATGSIAVRTMTDGGSNYPLEIGVSAVPPLAQAPPMFSAEGCFPKPAGAAAPTQPAARAGGL